MKRYFNNGNIKQDPIRNGYNLPLKQPSTNSHRLENEIQVRQSFYSNNSGPPVNKQIFQKPSKNASRRLLGSKLAPNIQIVVYFLLLGTILEALGALLGGSWSLLEDTWKAVEGSWGSLGQLLGSSWRIFWRSGVARGWFFILSEHSWSNLIYF